SRAPKAIGFAGLALALLGQPACETPGAAQRAPVVAGEAAKTRAQVDPVRVLWRKQGVSLDEDFSLAGVSIQTGRMAVVRHRDTEGGDAFELLIAPIAPDAPDAPPLLR